MFLVPIISDGQIISIRNRRIQRDDTKVETLPNVDIDLDKRGVISYTNQYMLDPNVDHFLIK